MDAILLCMKKRGIRFFRKIKFPTTNVVRFHAKNNFLGLLRTRYDKYDNILIMAHGSNNAILTTTTNLHEHFKPYINETDADAFKNDFVFAVSCLTANEFGKQCVDKGCITYLGFQVEIGWLFESNQKLECKIPNSVATAIDIIIKHIFVEELARAYEEFLKSPISVQILKERFAFAFEKRIAELQNLSVAQVHQKYSVKVSERHYKVYVTRVILYVLSNLDNVISKLICIGDENYISSSFIRFRKEEGCSSAEIISELESNPYFEQLKHEEYKCYLREIATG